MIRIYKIEPKVLAEVKKVLEEQERMEETGGEKKFIINEFAREGYSLRDGKSMGFKEEGAYLYIKSNEDFFKKNEPKIMKEGVKKLMGKEFERVRKEMEKEEDDAATGVGAIFGNL